MSLHPVKPGDTLTLLVERLAFGGKGVARVDGYTVFVDRGLPGQTVEVKITRRKKGWSEARVLRVVRPGPADVVPRCAHFGLCGGCSFQHLDYAAQLEAKREHVRECLERIGGLSGVEVEPVLSSPTPFEYRNKMEYSFAERWLDEHDPAVSPSERFGLGLHVRGRFDRVVEIVRCHLQFEEGSRILAFVREFAGRSGIPAYSTRTHRGFWRFLMLREGATTGERMVVVITHETDPGSAEWREVDRLGDALKARFPGLTSILHGRTDSKASVAFCPRERVLSGDPVIRERLLDFTFEIGPNTFFQTNTHGAERHFTEALARAELRPEDVVWDGYCGVGALTFPLARRARRVVGIEVVAESVEAARRNAKANGVHNVEFHAGDIRSVAAALAARGPRPDLIALDPPRDGVHADVIRTLTEVAPRRILYVSCNPATLARDLQLFRLSGYTPGPVLPVDLFPHTPHVECVTVLDRRIA